MATVAGEKSKSSGSWIVVESCHRPFTRVNTSTPGVKPSVELPRSPAASVSPLISDSPTPEGLVVARSRRDKFRLLNPCSVHPVKNIDSAFLMEKTAMNKRTGDYRVAILAHRHVKPERLILDGVGREEAGG